MYHDEDDSGVVWFLVGALMIAACVLAYLYFGDSADAYPVADRTPCEQTK